MVMALILQAKHVRKERGPTLVVAKLSLLSQWESEIHSKTDLTCRIHYGNSSGRLDFGDVVGALCITACRISPVVSSAH